MSTDKNGGHSQDPAARPTVRADAIDTVKISHPEHPDSATGVQTLPTLIESQFLEQESDDGTKEKNPYPQTKLGNSHARNYITRAWTAGDSIFRTSEAWFQEYVLKGLLRQRDVLRTKDGRIIVLDASRQNALVDERTGRQYLSNSIRSSRYTLLTFIPYQLWFQFTKAANFYFLVMGILQLIPGFSTTGQFTTILPLLFFLLLCIAREGYDDWRRYRLDKTENRRLARVLYGYRVGGVIYQPQQRNMAAILESFQANFRRQITEDTVPTVAVVADLKDFSSTSPSERSLITNSDPWLPSPAESDPWATVKWIDLKVGDIIEVRRDESVPADIVLLHTDGRNGFAYVETMALDGETNLKTRQPPAQLAEKCDSLDGVSACRAQFAIEDPNLDLYEFNGKVTVAGQTMPLTSNNVIYRGCTLRNTNRTIGVVVNTGEECKIRMNASQNPQTKAPVMQKIANSVVWILAAFVILVSVGCSAGYLIWTRVFERKAWYLNDGHIRFADIFIAYVIMFNNLIPLALYVSLEIVKFFQFIFLADIEMYDEVTDTSMVSNTQTMFENLGQIDYIFSDKTGTLTENLMRFRKFSVAGTAWLHNTEKKADGSMHLPTTIGRSVLPTRPSFLSFPSTVGSIPSITFSASDLPKTSGEPSTVELIRYLQSNPNTIFARRTRLFLLSLALCHTCFPEVQANGAITFQAASPDEQALVEAAQDLGYVVIDRITSSITLKAYPVSPDIAVEEVYQVLDVIDFSSKRKRMSIIVRFPDGQLCIFCKGADSVIKSRLKSSALALTTSTQVKQQHDLRASEEAERAVSRKSQDQLSRRRFNTFGMSLLVPSLSRRSTSIDRASFELDSIHEDSRKSKDRSRGSRNYHIDTLVRDVESLDEAGLFQRCFQHIDGFASEGLRTLVYAYRFLGEGEYASWASVYHEATTSLTDRQELIERAAETVEKDFDLAGATAIEDKLQRGVPETIDKLQRANIKIWMLTGDKRETAINIAHSAQLCKTYSNTIILDHEKGSLQDQIDAAALEVDIGRHSVVVIDGQTFGGIEHEDATTAFYNLLIRADSVICCRASPSQKAAMVKAIRSKLRTSVTLAIGDGGNDISMIQEAHVGVGISGKEGLQAARVADFSIAQFRFLQRLLLVHGHWSYVRTAKNILWTFWKEMLFYSIQIMYTRWTGYTGTSFYEVYSLIVWNTLFTSLCVMIPGIFEQDLSAATLLAVPELYSYGQQSRGFNLRLWGWWMVLGGIQSQVIWWCIYGLYGMAIFTEDQGLFALGNMAFSVCVIYINVKLLIFSSHNKTLIPLLACSITIAGWFVWNFILSAIYSPNPLMAVQDGIVSHFGRNLAWWLVHIIIVGALVLADMVIDVAGRFWWPSRVEIWQELERDEEVKRKLEELGGEGGYGVGLWGRGGDVNVDDD